MRSLEAHRKRLFVEARAVARLTRHTHVRQEAHLDAPHALPFAQFAATATRIERKAARRIAPHACLGHLRKEAPHGVPEPDVGRRTGTRRLADRRLIDFQHAVEILPGFDRAAPHKRRFVAVALLPHTLHKIVAQHIPRKCRLARPGHARDNGEPRQWNTHVHVAQVVQRSADDLERRRCTADRARRVQRVLQRRRQKAPGHRLRLMHDPRPCPPRSARRPACPRPARDRSRAPRAGSSLRRARPLSACFLSPADARAYRGERGYRAGASQWWARPVCSTRRAGSTRAEPRAECAALRRPKASGLRGRAPGNTARPRRERRAGFWSSGDVAHDSASRPATAMPLKNCASAETDNAVSSAIDLPR